MIIEHDVGAGIRGEPASEPNDRKRAREDGSPGPSKRRACPKEEIAANARTQRIQALLVSRVIYWLLHSVAPDCYGCRVN